MTASRWIDLLRQQDVLAQSSRWMARLHADDVSLEDVARFENWRSAHPGHAVAYDELQATFALMIRYGKDLFAGCAHESQ